MKQACSTNTSHFNHIPPIQSMYMYVYIMYAVMHIKDIGNSLRLYNIFDAHVGTRPRRFKLSTRGPEMKTGTYHMVNLIILHAMQYIQQSTCTSIVYMVYFAIKLHH